MKAEAAQRAATLLTEQRIAALGTLHAGGPSVTLAPFAVSLEPFGLLVLVSGLASHTKDLIADPRVGVMIAEPEMAQAPVHALPRVSVQAIAVAIPEASVDYAAARDAYGRRFPEMMALFRLADFGLYRLEPQGVRVVAGFAQAASISPEALASAVRELGA